MEAIKCWAVDCQHYATGEASLVVFDREPEALSYAETQKAAGFAEVHCWRL